MAQKLHVIIGSTRPGRVGPSIAKWFHEAAKAHGAFDAVLVDIADFKLPVFDEPEHPAKKHYTKDHTEAWAASVDAADAYVFVTPEYNYFAPPALVNALDFLVQEWKYKPAGIVSYGGVSAGLRAAQAVKGLMTALRIMPIPEGVAIPNFFELIDKTSGAFKSNPLMDASVKTMLDELAKWSAALKPMRAA